ncbi:MAG: GTP-binding protein [Planctomycetota bacterium]
MPTPVVILNGFLGSGKTTLLQNLLAQAGRAGLAVGVVVNDMSELDVDGVLVGESAYFEERDGLFQTIASCVLSSRKGIGELDAALAKLRAVGPLDLVIIETSGSCHPMPLVRFFQTSDAHRLTGILTLVDSAMIEQDYAGGERIFPTMQRNLQQQTRDTTNLLVEQVMFCSDLILTKADRLGAGRLQAIASAVHQLNPFVTVRSVAWGSLSLDDVLALPGYDFDRVAKLIDELSPTFDADAEEDQPYNLATRVIKDDRPFHPQRLWDTCQQQLGQHIYRSKGFFYLPTRDNVSLLWNQAAGGIDLELVGYWRAGIVDNPKSNLDEAERTALRERLAAEEGRFGDRRCHLTIIGDAAQVDRFAETLAGCFLTDDEIKQWQAGDDFPDPWPANCVATPG